MRVPHLSMRVPSMRVTRPSIRALRPSIRVPRPSIRVPRPSIRALHLSVRVPRPSIMSVPRLSARVPRPSVRVPRPTLFGQDRHASVCRALGLACRPLTCFVSAHDTNRSLTIDKYYDEEGEEVRGEPGVPGIYDSIWNFHCWNDVWIARDGVFKDQLTFPD